MRRLLITVVIGLAMAAQAQISGGGSGSVTNPLGALTANKCVMGNGGAGVSVDPNCGLDGSGNFTGTTGTFSGTVTAAGFTGNGTGNFINIPQGALSGAAAGKNSFSADSVTGFTYQSFNGSPFTCPVGVAPVNLQTGTTYTVLSSDCGKLVSASNAGAIAVTLPPPPAVTSPPTQYYYLSLQNTGTTLLTITPALANPPILSLSTSTSGGSIGAGVTVFVKASFKNASGETDGANGPEASITTGAGTTNSVTGIAPVFPTGVGAATNYCVYSSSSSGTELQNACPASGNYVITAVGAGAAPPSSNTALAGQIDGANSLVLKQNQGAKLSFNGSNWFSERGITDPTFALLASPTFTGTPAAPTAAALTNSTQLATTAFVYSAVNNTTWVFPIGNGSNLASFGTANVTRLYGFALPVQSTSTIFQYSVATADNTANLYDMGIYDSGGTLKAHLGATAGTTLFAATGSRSAAWTGGSVTLSPGKYWVGYTSNCAASCAVVSGASIFTFGSQAVPTANNATAGGALNSSVTPPADAWSVAGLPAMVLR